MVLFVFQKFPTNFLSLFPSLHYFSGDIVRDEHYQGYGGQDCKCILYIDNWRPVSAREFCHVVPHFLYGTSHGLVWARVHLNVRVVVLTVVVCPWLGLDIVLEAAPVFVICLGLILGFKFLYEEVLWGGFHAKVVQTARKNDFFFEAGTIMIVPYHLKELEGDFLHKMVLVVPDPMIRCPYLSSF